MSGTNTTDNTNTTDKLAIWFALHDLEVRYWYDVDFNGGLGAHEFYCNDGLFAVGPNRFEGQQGIKIFYEWRRSRGETTSRHVISNMIVPSQGERHARAFGVITIYRRKGSQPLEHGNVPALVADFTSECILGPDDIWRFASHIIDPVFVGNDVPLSLAIDPRFLAIARSNDNAGSRD